MSLPHVLLQYGERRPTTGRELLTSLGHPSKFQRVSRLGSVTARHSSNGRQPNFASLNRGRHLYSAGRPSRWALAYILVLFYLTRADGLRHAAVASRSGAQCTVQRVTDQLLLPVPFTEMTQQPKRNGPIHTGRVH